LASVAAQINVFFSIFIFIEVKNDKVTKSK